MRTQAGAKVKKKKLIDEIMRENRESRGKLEKIEINNYSRIFYFIFSNLHK